MEPLDPAYLETFDRIARRIARDERFDQFWQCRAGLWPDARSPKATVLKLCKQHWQTDLQDSISSTKGIFFSIWIDRAAIAQGGYHYNLHALKLRQFTGHSLQSRRFASTFRERFQSMISRWPEVSTSFGPQTLFQGFLRCPLDRLETVACGLAVKFIPVGTIIDEMLSNAAIESRK